MVETTFTVNLLTDDCDEGMELIDEIKRLIETSYYRYEIIDIEQEDV